MFASLIRLTCSVLLAITPLVTSGAIASSIEQPAQPITARTPLEHTAAASLNLFDAAGRPPANLSMRARDLQHLSDLMLQPDFRPLAAGAPQTITVQVVPNTLVANSGMTAAITATVYDITGDVVDGANLTGSITPGRGSVGIFPSTDLSGTATSTWTATAGSTTTGTGVIQVITGTVSGSAPITLTTGSPFTVTLLANPTNLTVGSSSALTATVVDQYQNPVADGTIVTFTSDIGTVLSPGLTANGVATSSITSTQAGTAHITATAGAIAGSAVVDVIAGPLNSIAVSPNPATVTAGATQSFQASGFDQYNNAVPITPTWTTNGGSINGSTGLFTAQITATTGRLVTATYSAIAGTASVNIVAGPLNSIAVSPNPATVAAGATQSFLATGLDQYRNTVPITPTWTTNGGSINGSTGLFTAQITATTGRLVTATYSAIAGTASVNIVAGPLNKITVTPNAVTMTVATTQAFSASGFDQYNNAVPITPTWTTNGGSINGSTGLFTAQITATTGRLVTATFGVVAGTASVNLVPAAFGRLTIENGPAGSGSAVNAVTLDIYSPLTVYAAAYDVYNNLIGARSVTWGGTGVVNGNLSSSSGISTTFTPAISGTGTITATSSGITDATGIITVQAPVLRISKTASPSPLTPGNVLQYTILYTNTGNATAQNVTITETYPASATFASAFPSATSGNNVWAIGSLAADGPHSIVVFMTTPNQMPVGTVLTNSVRMSAAKVASAFYTTTTPVNSLPDLSVSVTDSPDPVRPGSALYFTINYRNDGNAPATNVRITETYPAGVSFQSASIPPDSGYNNVWSIGTLNAGGSGTIVVTVRVNSPLADATVLNNSVAVAAQGVSPYTVTEQTLVTAPALQLTKSAVPAAPRASGLLTYTLFYTNSGSSYAASTTITDVLPANTSFVQCQPVNECVAGSTVTWWGHPNEKQINSGTSGTVTLTVRVADNLPNGTVITNTAIIASSAEQVSATAQLTSTVISAPDVTLSKSDGITQIAAGQVTTYTLNFANVGTAPAANVVITDRIPDYTTFVGCSSCVGTGGVYTFTRSLLNAGQSEAATISVRMWPTLPAGLRVITNTAGIATTTNGDAPANNFAQDVDNISTRPVLSLTAGFDSSTPYPGKVITYTVRYTNTSAMDTIGVVITATRSAGLIGAPLGWTKIGASDMRLIGDLPAGQSGSVTYVLTLPSSYTRSMRAFTVTFTIQDGGPGGLPPAQHQETALIGVPDLSIARVIVPSVASGQKFTATVIISNGGLGVARNPGSSSGKFYVDAFVDPAAPPPSYPYVSDGQFYAVASPVPAGMTATVFISNIVFAPNQDHILYFKVDNYSCGGTTCLPVGSKGGLVPEYNEYNNVSPAPRVYLPLALRN